ncbi:MAG: LLM class F420-dependent oxidoreductase [Deltaproteobacteria bacterium]|nr:LLM class F420-dependent oxidoreductase [Deltaproteobacteria bacterium]
MNIGLMYGMTLQPGQDSLEAWLAYAKMTEEMGFRSLWLPNIMSWDAMSALAAAGGVTERIELGTAVMPTYPRHPVAMAQQALSTGTITGDRFTLGIGLSHKIMIEDMMGMSYEKPAKHMKEYLEVLSPLLKREPVGHKGDLYRVHAGLDVPGSGEVPLLVAALGEIMLGHAGRLSAGTITWMTGIKTLAGHIVPKIQKSASDAGKASPRVVGGFPLVVTDDQEGARSLMSKVYRMYGALPSYRAMLDREGAAGPEDIALVGNEAELTAELGRLRDAGVTDLKVAVTPVEEGSEQRTLDFLASESTS